MRGLLRSFPHQPTSTSVPGATPPLPPASSTPLRTVTSGAPSDQLGDQPGIPSPSQRPFTLDSAAAAVASKPSTCSNSSPHMDVHIQFRSSTPPLDKADAPREASNPDASLGGVRKDPPPGKQARAPKRAKHAPRTSVGDAPQAVDRQVGEALMALKGKAAPTLATSTPATPAGTASLHPPLSAWAAAVNAPNPPVVDPVHALTHLLASNPNTANASTAANPQIDALSQLLLHGALPPAVLEVLVGQTQQQQQGKDLIAAALGSGMLPHIPAPQPQPIAQLALGATPSAPLRPVALGSRRLSVMLPNEPSLLPPSVRSAPIPKVSSTDKDPPSAAAVVGPRESVTQLTHEARLARHPSQHPIGMDVGQPLTARGELGIWSGKVWWWWLCVETCENKRIASERISVYLSISYRHHKRVSCGHLL